MKNAMAQDGGFLLKHYICFMSNLINISLLNALPASCCYSTLTKSLSTDQIEFGVQEIRSPCRSRNAKNFFFRRCNSDSESTIEFGDYSCYFNVS